MQTENLPDAASIVAAVKAHPGLVVLHEDEDSNFAFWLLDMTAPEFERWWLEREEFWWAVTKESQQKVWRTVAEVFGKAVPALRPAMVLPGKFIPCGLGSRYPVSNEAIELWYSFYESFRHHTCHICCDSDSAMRTPDGRYIYHRGYRGERMPDPKPFANAIPLP